MKILPKVILLMFLISDIWGAAEAAAGAGDTSMSTSRPRSALKGSTEDRRRLGGRVSWSDSTLERDAERAAREAKRAEEALARGKEEAEAIALAPPFARQTEGYEDGDDLDAETVDIGSPPAAGGVGGGSGGGILRRSTGGLRPVPLDDAVKVREGFTVLSQSNATAPGDGNPSGSSGAEGTDSDDA